MRESNTKVQITTQMIRKLWNDGKNATEIRKFLGCNLDDVYMTIGKIVTAERNKSRSVEKRA